MMIIGLTGSIGMGKSTAAKILRAFGLPIYSADAAVHMVLKKGGKAVAPVARLFPETLCRGAIDRKLLGQTVFNNPKKLRQLEKIIHPLLQQTERGFIQKARLSGARAAVLEIPLLFETGADQRCDVTLCVTAPRPIQRARVLARPGMSKEKFKNILRRQMSNVEKCRRAHYIVPTGTSVTKTRDCLRHILVKLTLLSGK